MSAPMDGKDLAVLGLEGAGLGAPEAIDSPRVGVAEAKGMAEPLLAALVALSPVEIATTPCDSSTLESIGVRAETWDRDPRCVKLVGPSPNDPLDVRLAGAPEALWVSGDEPGVAWLDLSLSGAFVVGSAEGRVVGRPEPDGVTLWPVLRTLDLPVLAGLEAPLDEWLAAAEDPWLEAEAAAAALPGDPWSVAVGAGLVARLAALTPAGAREIVDATSSGRAIPDLVSPRLWARRLGAADVSTIEILALAEVDRVSGPLEALEEEDELDGEARATVWIRACRGRDDLECAAVLLREAGRPDVLDAALSVLDRLGNELRATIDLRGLPGDERLHRAGETDPFAWWALDRL
jgi:hypothetical protein